RTVSVIDTRSRLMLRTLPTNASPNCLALSRDGKKLLVGHYYDKTVRIFNLEFDTFTDLPTEDTIADMALSRDDRHLYVLPTTDDGPVMMYDLNTGQLTGQISVGRDPAKITLVREQMPGIIRTEVSEGEIPVGGSQDIKVLFTAAGVDSGDYPEQIQIINNDPTNPVVSIPAYISVRPDTTPPAAVTDLIVNSGAYIYQAKGFDETQKQFFYTAAAVTQFEFQIKTRELPIDSGRVTVDIFGDFDNVNEYATVFIEEQSLGVVRGSVSGVGTGVWSLLAESLQAWLEDGRIKIKIENSPDVDVIYAGTDRHEVRLQIFSRGLDSTFVWDAVTLMWTAPGDDGNQGIAKAYDLRYGYTTIDETNWQQKIQVVNEPAPQPAGSLEKMVITNLIPHKRHFFALRAVDEAGNWSRLSNVASGFPDGGKPSLKMKFFQDPALSQFLDVIILSSEKLKSLTITADVGDSIQSLPVMRLDSVNFVYKGDYTFHASDTVRFTARGTDLAGNVGQIERTMNVQIVSSQKGGSIASLDQKLTLNFQPQSLARTTFITLVEQSTDIQPTELQPVSPIYQFGPKGETLQKPSTLIFNYPEEKVKAELRFTGIYFRMTSGEDWALLESHIDTVAGIVTAEVSQLGEYALFLTSNADPRLIHIVPHIFQLFPNYPNPFNSETVIQYHLPMNSIKASDIPGSVEQKVTLKIYNLLGQEVRTLVDEFQKPGSYTIHWDGRDNNGNPVTSGVYFYKMNAGKYQQTRKMAVVR
ncbi:MAG: T9SS type A sorting domain-containing protein, partial [candidate division KSB1 bacterium]|nr:T9SS type A sorting domain-containing protein [candidate division KSB1 bacterium]